jgi:PKD repeat protein
VCAADDAGRKDVGTATRGSRRSLARLVALLVCGAASLLVAGANASAETYREAVEGTSGVTHFWPMGEASGSSFADVVGGSDAEVSGGVSLGEPGGLVGDSSTAASFNGSSGAAQAKIDLSGTSKLTVEFWMKWSVFAEDDHLALEFTPNFNEYPGGFLVDPDATPESDFAVAVGRSALGNNNNVLFTRPSVEVWHYYAFVINTEASGETEITPYVDGHAVSYSKLSSDTGAGAFADSTLYWMSRDASSLFGAGSMQDLALYETTLSASTISEHYELGEGGPKASFSSTPVQATVGVPVKFDASGSSSPGGSVTDYAWDFNGSKSYSTDQGGTATVSHTFSSPGTYTVDLRVKDSLGESAVTSETVTVGAALGQYEQAVEDTAGISHFWPMDESSGSSFADVFGGANAELSGGVMLGEPGALVGDSSTAASFNGSSGAAQAKVDLSGTSKLTVEFWMKWSMFAEDDHLALEFTPNFNENDGGFLVDPDSTPESDFSVAVGRGATGNSNNSLFERPSAEAWHYYAFVIDTEASGETEITPYVDGHAVSYFKLNADAGAGAFANSVLYWMSRDASSLFGAGSMQDLALYETTLSASTISEHYELGEGGPKASFTSTPVQATAGVPVKFDASGSASPAGTVTDYAWDFDGSKSYSTDQGGTATVSHTFSSPGTYTVDLRVKDSIGESAVASETVTVGAALGLYEQGVEDTPGLSHFWPMGESSGSSLADVFGGANAEISGGVSLGEPGALAGDATTAAAFNGSSGAAHAAVDLSGTSRLTIEFWMKWNAFAGDDHLALEFTPNFNENPGGFLVDPDATPGSDFSVAVGRSATSNNNNALFVRPSAEQWHYYAFVIDTEASGATEIAPYVDGHAVSYTKLAEDTGAGNFADSTLYWMSRDASSLFGAGTMQDLALYKTTLSSGTILRHYELATTGCTDTWTGEAGGDSWETAGNWSAEAVPTSDDVACIGSGTTVHVTAGDNTAGRLKDEGSLVVSGGTLEVANATTPSSVASLTVGGGTLTGAAEVDVSEALTWTEGTMSGSGKTVLEPGVSSKINPFTWVTLSERELVNQGILSWESGAIVTSAGAEISNEATFYADDDGPHCTYGCDGTGISVESGSVSFENTASGKITKEAGAITYIAVPFNNEGEVETTSGKLQFSHGGVADETGGGSWAAGPGDLIEFSSGSFALGTNVELAGEVAITGGVVEASGLQGPGAKVSIEGATLDLEESLPSELESLSIGTGPTGRGYGLLKGSSEARIAKSFEWSEGAIRGISPLVLESGSTGEINPVSDDILDESTLINEGTLNWYSGRLVGAGDAELLNEGTYEVNDQGPHDECVDGCVGYHTGMNTANWLLENPSKTYNFGEIPGGEAETFTGGASLINEGEITDPEVSCPPDSVEIQWPTTGSGSYNDPCTSYTSSIIPSEHEAPEEEESGLEAVPHPGVGSPISEGEACKASAKENEHCYALVESPSVEPPAGFLGSSVEIDPICLATNGDNENFTDAEQWVAFITKSLEKEGVLDWTEAGVKLGESETITWPHYFIADTRGLNGLPAYHEHEDDNSVSLGQYLKDEIWYVNGSQWEAWLPGYHMISAPQPEFAKLLQAGTENTANDVSAEAKFRNIEYETTTKGTWRKGWEAEHREMKERVIPEPPHNSGVAKVTSPTTAEVSFNFPC